MVKVWKRAITNASPRWAEVTRPPGVIFAELSLLLKKNAREVTSRSVPSEYFARTTSCWVALSPRSTMFFGMISAETGTGMSGLSPGAPASIQRMTVL